MDKYDLYFFTAIDFLTPLKDISSVEGTKSVFEAKITAADVSSVKWYHNDKLVIPNDRVQMVAKGSKQRLVLNRTYASDEGQYKMVVGRVDSTCKLTVQSTFCIDLKNNNMMSSINKIIIKSIINSHYIIVAFRNQHCKAYGRLSLYRDSECHI